MEALNLREITKPSRLKEKIPKLKKEYIKIASFHNLNSVINKEKYSIVAYVLVDSEKRKQIPKILKSLDKLIEASVKNEKFEKEVNDYEIKYFFKEKALVLKYSDDYSDNLINKNIQKLR